MNRKQKYSPRFPAADKSAKTMNTSKLNMALKNLWKMKMNSLPKKSEEIKANMEDKISEKKETENR